MRASRRSFRGYPAAGGAGGCTLGASEHFYKLIARDTSVDAEFLCVHATKVADCLAKNSVMLT
jgi:hypothetical protein